MLFQGDRLTPPPRSVCSARTFAGTGQSGTMQSGTLQLRNQATHIIGQRHFPLHPEAAQRMDQAKPRRMQRLPWENRQFGVVAPIDRIADQGVADRGHVDTNLMGSPGIERTFDIATVGETLKY